jgi:hypothetical protein
MKRAKRVLTDGSREVQRRARRNLAALEGR